MNKIPSKERVAHGLCPNCGKEAAPYYLCWDCRFSARLNRALRNGVKKNVLEVDVLKRYTIRKGVTNTEKKEWTKRGTPVVLPESDKRGRPRLKGIRIDVDATLIAVIQFIGRPCTIEEILAAWGKLRDKRNDPLPNDLGRLIKAADKREAKKQRRLAALNHSEIAT